MNVPAESTARHQRGLSLVELMIALAISVIISLGVVNLFLQTKVSFMQDEEISRLQENGRWALRYVSRELSMTGFYGSVVNGATISSTLAVASDCGVGWTLDTASAIEHLNNATDTLVTTTYACLGAGEVVPGTDILVVRRTKDSPAMTDGNVLSGPENNAVYLRLGQFGSAGALVRGSDLTLADKTAGSGVDAWEYQPQILFVRPWSSTAGDGIPTLCTKKITRDLATLKVGDADCLVEGVENLQIEYGLDTSSPPDYTADYYTANPTAAELEEAVNARIFVLARSINEVSGYINDKSYQLGGTTVAAANDGHYRRMLQTTVVLRNGELFGF